MRFSSNPELVRNFVFGVEDSLVSTVGLVSGIATAGMTREAILITGLILILVEAFSMAVGSLVSDNSTAEFIERREVAYGASVKGAWIMFFSYFFAGVLVLLPYVVATTQTAFPVSIGVSVVCLFFLGMASGKLAGIKPIRKGIRMAVIGGLAVIIGSAVGFFFR